MISLATRSTPQASHQPCRYLNPLRPVFVGNASRSVAWGKTIGSADRWVPPSGGYHAKQKSEIGNQNYTYYYCNTYTKRRRRLTGSGVQIWCRAKRDGKLHRPRCSTKCRSRRRVATNPEEELPPRPHKQCVLDHTQPRRVHI